MEWVHCNCCNRQPLENKKFCLTNCGHLFCEDCVAQDKEPCKVCGQICMVLVLTAPLKPEVAIYFTEPYEMLQKYFKEITKIMEFQKGHGKKLIAGFKSRVGTLNDKLQEALKNIRELENENENLQRENANLRDALSNSPFRGLGPQAAGVPEQPLGSAGSFMSTCSSSSTLTTRGGQGQQRRTSTPMTSKRLTIHTPQGGLLLSGNVSGSVFSRRGQESQTLRMLSQSPAFSSSSSSVSNKSRPSVNAGQHQRNTPCANRQLVTARNPSTSTPGSIQKAGHHLASAPTSARGYNGLNALSRHNQYDHGTPESVEQLSPLNRPIGLKVDYPSLRSELNTISHQKLSYPHRHSGIRFN